MSKSSTEVATGKAVKKSPMDVPCTCGHPDSIKLEDHTASCPRGQRLIAVEYGKQGGKAKNEKKALSSRENALKASEKRRKDPLDVDCTCTGGASLAPGAHTHSCPRGRLLKQRARNAAKKKVATKK